MGKEFKVTDNKEALLWRIWQAVLGGSGGGGLPVAPVSPTNAGLGVGRQVVPTSGTPVALAASTASKVITIQAEKDNTSDVIVGDASVVGPLATREGIYLSPGDSIDIPVNDLSLVYIDALVDTEGVTYIYSY